jgi:hypothetical protein
MEKDNLPHEQTGYIEERRKYIRLDAVFPVEFQFLDPDTGGSISDIKQGFTCDVGKGGICLEVNNIEEGFEKLLKEEKIRLDLRLHIPLSHRETKATASVAWYKKVKSGYPNKYLIGLSFQQIDTKEKERIYFHAKRISLAPRVVSILVLFLIFGLIYFYTSELKLKKENQRLLTEFVELSGRKSELEKRILSFDAEYGEIEDKLLENQKKAAEYENKVDKLKHLSLELKGKTKLLEYFQHDSDAAKKKLKIALLEKQKLSAKVNSLSEESAYLKERISVISKNRVSAEDNLKALLASFENIEERSISSMYSWIKNHQNGSTGLVVSYEGDKDVEDWAFIYDQSLACQCFVLKGDQDNARQILDFYKDRAEKKYGVFTNAYDVYTGNIIEYTVHAGPNIWLGIAVLQYIDKFKDETYLSMAEDIGKWLIRLQEEDPDYGIRGGPEFTWFSTEHNLDAYAFFGMLYKITQQKKYLQAQRRALEWIKYNAYNRKEQRLNRGKGDATIATDTFTWSIAAIGPDILYHNDMDPDQIVDFAETNCLVETYFVRPNGERVKVTGFDFGKYEHLARGGIVSTEWTAQMIVTLRIMEKYHKENNNFIKSDYYRRKASFYLSELEKMVIISPSKIGRGEGCLPYASQDNVDTGHGWKVVKGSRTGSTAGTAYTIFAKYNYNPLMLE